MMIRKTLNNLAPRTMRDARRDPYDWWRGPERSPRPDSPAEQIAGVVLTIIIGIVGAVALVHWLAS
jgi:hypothetical protein